MNFRSHMSPLHNGVDHGTFINIFCRHGTDLSFLTIIQTTIRIECSFIEIFPNVHHQVSSQKWYLLAIVYQHQIIVQSLSTIRRRNRIHRDHLLG